METESSLNSISRQKKLYFFNENLREMHSKLDHEIQSRIPLENLLQLSIILLDDPTIFQIVQCLRENQNSTEKILKSQRDEQVLIHQREIEVYTRTLTESELAHTVALAKMQHAKKMKDIDKEIINKLNVIVTEQQETLFALKIPGFYPTFDNKTIISQMHLLSFMIKLQQLVESQKQFN